ncbi:hypothetical protein IKF81_01700 [Candidatus Saccharibacteria bacterium]|nr:hypothetical protein [Candidatus Saccharibacteria bacterium]
MANKNLEALAYFSFVSGKDSVGAILWYLLLVGDNSSSLGSLAVTRFYTTTSGNMQDSICPKGWGLPINGDAQTTKSWINLLFTSYGLQDNDSTSSLNAHKTPLSFVYSGAYGWGGADLYNRGSGSAFWSSTPFSATGAHGSDFYSAHLLPQYGYNKIYGFTIRCVVQ